MKTAMPAVFIVVMKFVQIQHYTNIVFNLYNK